MHINVPSSLASKPQPPVQQLPHVALDIETLPAPLPQRRRLLPKQISYTDSGADSGAGGGVGVAGAEAYSRYFSRQNTSEDSANVTVSTVLAQSDSQSLHATPSYANTPPGPGIRDQERRKSRSTGLLAVRPQVPVDPHTVVIPIEGAERPERGARSLVAEKLHRMTSTSTGSSVAATTGCCSAAKPKERTGEPFRPTLPSSAATTTAQSTGSDDEYRRRKRKYSKSTLSRTLQLFGLLIPFVIFSVRETSSLLGSRLGLSLAQRSPALCARAWHQSGYSAAHVSPAGKEREGL